MNLIEFIKMCISFSFFVFKRFLGVAIFAISLIGIIANIRTRHVGGIIICIIGFILVYLISYKL